MANEIKDLIDYMKSDAAERRKAEKEAIEKDRQQLETLRQGFEAQGQNADDNAKFRSADISLQRRELALRKEDATGKSAQEEIAKEERALREKEGGMLNKIALGITDLGKDFKAKAANVGKGILKGTLLAGLFLAAAAFFQSPLFGKMIDFLNSIDMKPILLEKEIEAFVADRLLEAIWRESLWLIKDGICTTKQLDDIVRYGFGLRYAQMGVFQTYRTAAGEGGMRQFLEHFGPCLSLPWTKLMDVPEFNNELIDLISNQSDTQANGLSVTELEQIRDKNLVEIQKALEKNNYGAGKLIKKAREKAVP